MEEDKLDDEGYSWKAFLPWTEEHKKMVEETQSEEESLEEKDEFEVEEYLNRAGLDISEESLKKRLFQTSIGICLLLTAFVLFISMQSVNTAVDVLIFLAGLWTVGFIAIFAIISFGFMLYIDLRMYRRTKELEKVLPDFLQLASANISAGMPLDRALWFAVRPQFGILAEEIEIVAKSTYAGKDLDEALQEFAGRFDSRDLNRAVSLILEGMDAGGEMADLLNKIAMNIEETEILRKEMAANVTTYVIFISIATLVGAPFLFGLATQLLNVIQNIAAGLGGGSASSGMISLSINPDAVSIDDFKVYASAMLIVTSFFSGAIISVIRKGDIKEGAVTIPAFVVSTLFLYMIANQLLGGLMGTFF